MPGERKREEEAYDDLPLMERIIQPIVAEFTGSFLLAYVCAMSVTSSFLLPISVAQGFATGALCVAFVNISGGHFNPCTTLSVWLSGGMPLLPALLYLPAQFLGAIFGALFVRASLVTSSYNDLNGGANMFRGNRMINSYNEYQLENTWETTPVLGLITNVIVSIAIFLCYLQCNVDNRRDQKIPLAYGFAITAATIATYVTSGGGFNPVVSLCTGMLAGYFDDMYIYIVAPLCGCLIAAGLFRTMLGDNEKRFIGK